MPERRTLVVIGGTAGIGLELVRRFAGEGHRVVLSGRDSGRAEAVAKELGPGVTGIGLDLSRPDEIGARLSGVDGVDHLVLAGVERDQNNARDYDYARAIQLVTLKLVGYTETVHVLAPRMPTDGSIVLFGGLAKDRPYPGSTTVSTVNGGVTGLVHALAVELAPIRVNALHPGVVVDSPYWMDKTAAVHGVRERTPGGRTVTMADVVDAAVFLLHNRSVNGIDLPVDGGWLLR